MSEYQYDLFHAIQSMQGWKVDTDKELSGLIINRDPDEFFDYGTGYLFLRLTFHVLKGVAHIKFSLTTLDDGVYGAWKEIEESKGQDFFDNLKKLVKSRVEGETLCTDEFNKQIFHKLGMHFQNEG